MIPKKDIKKILDYDALAEAEKISHKSYKEDDVTGALGFMLHLESSQKKNKLMQDLGDTCFSETVESYFKKATEIGFKVLYKEDFEDIDGNDISQETLFIMWHYDYSILLVWDTHRGNRNGGKFYYNWSPHTLENRHHFTSSGGFAGFHFNKKFKPLKLPKYLKEPKWDGQPWSEYSEQLDEYNTKLRLYRDKHNHRAVWSGDHDCREALKFNVGQLAENGEFLKQWIKCPFIWLLHYVDYKDKGFDGYDYVAINKERLSKLPKKIQKIINYQK